MKINRKFMVLLFTVCTLLAFAEQIDKKLDGCGNPISKFNNSEIQFQEITRITRVDTADIIISFATPSSYISDLAWDGQYLWGCGYDEFEIFQISPVNGTVIRTIPTDVQRPHGLTYDGQYLWIADADNFVIQQINPEDGFVVHSFQTPGNTRLSYPAGLAWDGTNLWHNDCGGPEIADEPDLTFYINPLGHIFGTYESIGNYPTGLAWDGQYLWSSDNALQEIHRIDPVSFECVQSFSAPGGNYPNGLTWDGEYLWVSNNDSNMIYQLNVNSVSSTNNELNIPDYNMSNFPNPFNPTTTISFTAKNAKDAKVEIFNLKGQLIVTLSDPSMTDSIEGRQTHSITWNGDDESGKPVSSGIYYYKLNINGKTEAVKKCLLMK